MFSDKDRAIYQCPETQRFYDPLAVKRAMVLAGRGRFNDAVRLYNGAATTPEEKAQAEAVLVAAGRAAFGIAPIDPATGQGLGDAVVLTAVTSFTMWLKGKVGPVQSGPNSAPCTDCPQAAN